MDKKKHDNHKLDAAGQALVQDDSRTLREQGRGFILSDVLAATPAPTRTGNGRPGRRRFITDRPPYTAGGFSKGGHPHEWKG